MSRLNLIAGTAAAAILVGAGGAVAADMPVYYEPEPVFGGWYLRGDIGVSHQRVDRVDNWAYYDPNYNDSWISFGDDFDSSWFLGIGVGYQFNDWFRADITGEYRGGSDYHGIHAFDTDGDTAIDLVDDYTGEKTEWTFLLNGYWDFYRWEKMSFFVGAGVGASYNKISDFIDIDPNNPNWGGGPLCAVGNGCASDNGEWHFAWALHAGMAFAVTPNMAVEVAYRYLNLGEASTGDLTGNTVNDPVGNPMRFHDLDSHDVKIGLRYTLN